MTRSCLHIASAVFILCALFVSCNTAYGAKPLQRSALVLPIQDGPSIPSEKAYVGTAVQSVLENMLALHSGLRETWLTWNYRKVFPTAKDFKDWVGGKGDALRRARALRMRYLIYGHVSLFGDRLFVQLKLVDQVTRRNTVENLKIDLPRLASFRRGFLEMLSKAGIPVPSRQQTKMLWKENLSLNAMVLLGQRRVAPLIRVAPRSYLAFTKLGYAHYKRKKYSQAEKAFRRALALNRFGVDAASGMSLVARAMGKLSIENTWVQKVAEMQGKNPKAALARLWNLRGNTAFKKRDYRNALEHYRKAIILNPRVVVYVTNFAIASRLTGKYAQGKRVLEAGLRTFSSERDQRKLQIALADVHFFWAKGLKRKHAYSEAIRHYRTAFEIDFIYRKKRAATDLNNLGLAHAEVGRSSKAISYLRQALSIQRDVRDLAGQGATLANLGSVYRQLSQYEKATTYLKQAVPILRKVKKRKELGTTFDSLGQVFGRMSRYPEAIAYYKQALSIRREINDRGGVGITLNNLGEIHRSVGNYDKAIFHYQQALVAMRKVKDRRNEGIALSNLGIAYNSIGQSDKAISFYKQALTISRRTKNRLSEGSVLHNLAHAVASQGRYSEAISFYKQALAIRRQLKDRFGMGNTLNNLGASYGALGQFGRAETYYKESLSISRKIKNRLGEGNTLNNLGVISHYRGKHRQANAYWEEALAISHELNNKSGEGILLNNLGMASKFLGKSEKATNYFQSALKIARLINAQSLEGTSLNNLGSIHHSIRRYDKAISYYQKALIIYRQGKFKHKEGTTLENLMFAWKGLRKSNLAIFYGKQSVSVLQGIRGNLRKLDKDIQQSFLKSKENVYRELSDLLISEGRLSEAQQVMALLKQREFLDFLRGGMKDAKALGIRPK